MEELGREGRKAGTNHPLVGPKTLAPAGKTLRLGTAVDELTECGVGTPLSAASGVPWCQAMVDEPAAVPTWHPRRERRVAGWS